MLAIGKEETSPHQVTTEWSNSKKPKILLTEDHIILVSYYAGSAGSVAAGNNPTDLQMNSTVVNGAGESNVSLPGVMSECHDQKVCFLHYSGILFVTSFWLVLNC